jgi:hypothetical protein
MSRTKRSRRALNFQKDNRNQVGNEQLFRDLIEFVLPDGELFSKSEFHGNIKWVPEQLAVQALIWSWQDSRNVTEAFVKTQEICEQIGVTKGVANYTTFINALSGYREVIGNRLRLRFQELAEEIGGRFFRTDTWVPIGFDGSRATAPRSVANEIAFCAPNYGRGQTATYRKTKSKGLQRQRIQNQQIEPQSPQVWITMMWHMRLRLPWSWRLGPSNSCERWHVQEILEEENFPEKTLFCGDAGFVGYPLWKSIIDTGSDFLIRVGANAKLLTEHATIERLQDGIVLCWPKDRMAAGDPPLKLRLVQVKVGKTKMWMLTSVRDRQKFTQKQIVRYYKMRWGIEVEYRGLKQTIDKHKLRCRNSQRLLAELDWALRGMAIAELIALRHQIPKNVPRNVDYTPNDRSLANTLRALRKCMRNLGKQTKPTDNLSKELNQATVQRYHNRTDKRARYRPKNHDIKPLGDPVIRILTDQEREKLRKLRTKTAA